MNYSSLWSDLPNDVKTLFDNESTLLKYKRGDKLCKKDDAANEMFLTVTGKFLVRVGAVSCCFSSRQKSAWM